MNKAYPNLLRPMKIGSVEIKNRFAAGPLTLPSLYGPYGEFSLDGLAYFEARAKGGFGLIFSGALYPDAEIDPVHPYDSKWPMKAPKEFMRTAKELNERLSFYADLHGARAKHARLLCTLAAAGFF